MKHIVMIKRGAGPGGVLRPGKVHLVDDDLAKALVDPKSVDPESDYLPFARYAKPEEVHQAGRNVGEYRPETETATLSQQGKRRNA